MDSVSRIFLSWLLEQIQDVQRLRKPRISQVQSFLLEYNGVWVFNSCWAGPKLRQLLNEKTAKNLVFFWKILMIFIIIAFTKKGVNPMNPWSFCLAVGLWLPEDASPYQAGDEAQLRSFWWVVAAGALSDRTKDSVILWFCGLFFRICYLGLPKEFCFNTFF